VEVLDDTDFVVVAGADDSHLNPSTRIQTWHIGKGIALTRQTFHTPVLNVKVNKTNIIVVRETSIHIFKITDLDKELAILTTESNPNGVCALSPSSDRNGLLAYPPKCVLSSIQSRLSLSPPPLAFLCFEFSKQSSLI